MLNNALGLFFSFVNDPGDIRRVGCIQGSFIVLNIVRINKIIGGSRDPSTAMQT